MAGKLPGNPSQDKTAKETPSVYMPQEPQCLTRKWYLSRQEIEDHSPSRKDGIDHEEESQLQKLYCSFLQELGIEPKVPQLTIATAMMLCHRFYMRQSHAKNDWQCGVPLQTIATVTMFLACKAEETPRWLNDVAVVAYKLMYSWDPSAPRRIRRRDVYDKQKELILTGERLMLSTVAFDLNIEHPYKPLVAVLKRLEISHKDLAKVARNFVSDWLRTTLCLQYKPHYIAAGSTFLAAKFQRVKLPTEMGNVWRMQFDILPKLLEVIQQMKQALPPMNGKVIESKAAVGKMTNVPQSGIISGSNFAQNNGHGVTVDAGGLVKSTTSNRLHSCIKSGLNVADHTAHGALVDAGGLVKSAISSSPQSCIISSSNVAQDTGHGAIIDSGGLVKSAMSKCSENESSSDFHVRIQESLCCQTSDCGSANSAVEDCDVELRSGESDRNSSSKIVSVQVGDSKIDVDRIKEALKRRQGQDRIANKKLTEAIEDEIDSEAWIERKLENGIELESASVDKRRRF